MREMKITRTWDLYNAVQTGREEKKMHWPDFEIESGVTCDAVLKWGRKKNGCLTESALRALKAVGLEMVVRPISKEDEGNAE